LIERVSFMTRDACIDCPRARTVQDFNGGRLILRETKVDAFLTRNKRLAVREAGKASPFLGEY
jgi:hypothetical protein